MRHAAIIEHARPGRQNGALFHFPARQPAGRGVHDLELGDGGVAQTLDLGEPGLRRSHHLGEGAEFGDQVLGQRLDVALRDGAEQHQFEQLVLTTVMGLVAPTNQTKKPLFI